MGIFFDAMDELHRRMHVPLEDSTNDGWLEIASFQRALEEMTERDLLGGLPIEIVGGSDEYLFGEWLLSMSGRGKRVVRDGSPLPP